MGPSSQSHRSGNNRDQDSGLNADYVMQSDSQKLTFWWPSWHGPLCLALQVGRVSFFQSHSFLWTVNASEILPGFFVVVAVVVVGWPPPSFQLANTHLHALTSLKQKLSTLITVWIMKKTYLKWWVVQGEQKDAGISESTSRAKRIQTENDSISPCTLHLKKVSSLHHCHSTTVSSLFDQLTVFLPGHSCPKTGGCRSLSLKEEGLGDWLRLMHAEQACSYRVVKGGAD